MLFRGLGILSLGLIVAGPATAQTFSNTIFFGDSRTDSGYFLYKPFLPGNPNFGLAPAGTGTWTTNPGLGWAPAFGQKFGIAVTPSDTPVAGGNNYAIGGARVAIDNANGNIFSTNTQIQTYFANTGGVADPNALYTFWVGVNDLKSPAIVPNLVNPQNTAGILALANQAIGQVVSLANAGARYFLVPNGALFSNPAYAAAGLPNNTSAIGSASRALYDQTVWNGLAANGINFIPADHAAMLSFVLLNPAQFGITNVNFHTPACGVVNSYQCGPANYVVPNADKTYFWADGTGAPDQGGHLAAAPQKIIADYFYSLVVAPSEISFLAEAPVKTRAAVVNSITSQIPLSFGTPGVFHGWVSGDVSWLKVTSSYAGFPDDPGTPVSTTAGFDYAITRDWLVGAAFSGGTTKQTFSLGGDFKQTEYAVSLYTAYRRDAFWLNAIGTWGSISDTVNRQVPLGISLQSNQGSTNGTNISFAAETGYNFRAAVGTLPPAAGMALKAPSATSLYLTHGPVIGIILQQVHIGQGFESGEAVTVAATDYGTDPVAGTLVGLSDAESVVRRVDARAGTVHVHFPRFGFQIKKGTPA